MSFSLQPNPEGRSQVVLKDEPPFIVSLPIAPLSLEEMLKHGRWLIVSFSVWSLHDLAAAHRAIEVVKQYGGQFRLGLRPFDYYEENLTWLPPVLEPSRPSLDIEFTEERGKRIMAIKGRTDASPIWTTLADGQFIAIRFGQLIQMDFDNLVRELLTMEEKSSRD